jgi:N-carbamoyl-L-amino-acid hydrolase
MRDATTALVTPQMLADTIADLRPLAVKLFDDLYGCSRDAAGVTRPSYSTLESKAAAVLQRAAHAQGLQSRFDAAGNLLVTRPDSVGARSGIVTGSHLDSVLRGGNFDGAAGIVAGLLVLAALEKLGITLAEPVTLIGTRGEESAWYSVHHIGARGALGILKAEEIECAKRYDTGRSLADDMAEVGCDLDAIRNGVPTFDTGMLRAFLELHIEQGPVLVHENLPVGIVSGIRGNVRVREARYLGEYAHSGAVPRKMRKDAFLAMAEFAHRCEAEWEIIEAAGGDLVLTFGKAYTNPDDHSHNKVPGEAIFVVDARSHEIQTLDRMDRFMRRVSAEIAERRGLQLVFQGIGRVTPAAMNEDIQTLMKTGAEALGIPMMPIASGGGHDAGDFSNLGVPTGMIFIRNPNGSHNPAEAMDIDDFIQGARILGWTIMTLGSAPVGGSA